MMFECLNIFMQPCGFSPITRHIDKREERPTVDNVVKTIFNTVSTHGILLVCAL